MTIDQRILNVCVGMVEKCKDIDGHSNISLVFPKATEEDVKTIQTYVRDKTGYWPASTKGDKGYGINIDPSMVK